MQRLSNEVDAREARTCAEAGSYRAAKVEGLRARFGGLPVAIPGGTKDVGAKEVNDHRIRAYLRAIAAFALEAAERPELLACIVSILALVPATLRQLRRERQRLGA